MSVMRFADSETSIRTASSTDHTRSSAERNVQRRPQGMNSHRQRKTAPLALTTPFTSQPSAHRYPLASCTRQLHCLPHVDASKSTTGVSKRAEYNVLEDRTGPLPLRGMYGVYVGKNLQASHSFHILLLDQCLTFCI